MYPAFSVPASDDLGGDVVPSGVDFTRPQFLIASETLVQFTIQQDDVALEDDEFYTLSVRSLHPRVIVGGGGLFATTTAIISDDDGMYYSGDFP